MCKVKLQVSYSRVYSVAHTVSTAVPLSLPFGALYKPLAPPVLPFPAVALFDTHSKHHSTHVHGETNMFTRIVHHDNPPTLPPKTKRNIKGGF